LKLLNELQSLSNVQLTSKNWLVNELVRRHLARALKSYARGVLVDIGCGLKPYEELGRPYIERHVGVDHPATLHGTHRVDIAATAYAIPVPDQSFDSALCSAVLEHLEEPEQAIRECFRVLKPGGHAIYTVPLMWHLHEEPRDFFRYTKYGLKHLFSKVGFEIVELTAMSGFWVTFGQLSSYVLHRRNRGWLKRARLIPPIGGAIQLTALMLDRLDHTEQWTWAYLAVVRKPGSAEQG
jgi:SAM-dependent methyltransferase